MFIYFSIGDGIHLKIFKESSRYRMSTQYPVVNTGQFLNNIFQSFRLHFSGRPRLIEAALQESATLSATLIDKLWHLWHTFLFCHERHTFVAPIDLISVTSIHERPIFRSLATNLGTTFKAPRNLGTQKGEDSQ